MVATLLLEGEDSAHGGREGPTVRLLRYLRPTSHGTVIGTQLSGAQHGGRYQDRRSRPGGGQSGRRALLYSRMPHSGEPVLPAVGGLGTRIAHTCWAQTCSAVLLAI